MFYDAFMWELIQSRLPDYNKVVIYFSIFKWFLDDRECNFWNDQYKIVILDLTNTNAFVT